MSSSSINPLPAVPPDSLSDFELKKLSERLKPCTWFIKVSYKNKNSDDVEAFGTGFAIKVGENALKSIEKSDLVIVTCAHYLPTLPHSIAVRGYEDKCFLEAEVVVKNSRSDTTILVVKGANRGNYCEFCDDGSISECQTLLQVGHSEDMVWSVFVGRASYPCVNYLPSGPIKTCLNFPGLDLLEETPKCRIMGNIWNKPYFVARDSKKFLFEKNLNPWIPIIQCYGFLCRPGCSGGPVFNTQGKVVGMLVGEFDGFQTAIHVALLKEFVKTHTTNPQGSSEVSVEELAGGGEDALRGVKRKEGPM